MSSEVDDKIVSIQFDNASFERNMTQTLRSLDKLSESLRFAGAEKGFQNISNAANHFDTSHMANAVDDIAHRFSAMGIAGATAIARLTVGALDFAKNVGGDILSPILTGGKSRAVNLEQAKFLFQGIGIDVQKGMDSALKAVKGTAFGLDEAAKIAAQFGASGIKAGQQMTDALTGVAGVAALTGRSFSEIGDIFAQSAATGVVNNQDLLQFATRGLNAAAALGKQMHLTEAQVHDLASQGKISFKEFADAMNKAFGAHAKDANKTYQGSLANLHAALSRLGASFIAPHLEQQRDLFNALTPVIDNVSAALLPLINDFIVLKRISINKIIGFLGHLDVASFQTGVSNIAVGLVNLYKALKPIGNAIKDAFHEIFSGSVGKGFIGLTSSFKDFTEKIKIGADTISGIKSAFKGFFAALEIGFTIFKEVIKTIGAVIHALIPAGDGLLSFSANTGDFITKMNEALVAGGGIERFFDKLRDVITHPITSLIALKDAISDFFHGINFASQGPIKLLQDLRDKLFSFFHIHVGDAAEKGLGRIGQRLDTLHNIFDTVQKAFSKVHDFLKPVLDYMTHWLKTLGQKLAGAFHKGDFNTLLDVINIGLLGGIVVLLRNFFRNGLKLNFKSGFLGQIQGAFSQLTNTLQAMQTQLKAKALLQIALAIGVLTASLVVLSLIDSKALTKALVALSVSFGQLIGALTLLDKLNFKASALKLTGVASAMILIASAAVVLSAAIKILSTIKLGDLAKGLIGVGTGLGLLVAATRGITADTAGLISAGVAMGTIAFALLVLSKAVKEFGNIPLGEMAKGLIGVSAGLLAVVTAMNFMPPTSILSGAGFIEVAVGLTILAGAVKLFSLMSFGEMAKGLIGIAGGLIVIAAAMNLMPINIPITAAGILVLSVALTIMAKAVQLMGRNDFGVLAKGIGAFAAMLLILVVAVNAMDTALPGAAALFVVSAALKVLGGVLADLGKLKISELITGLAAIAGVLLILGVASALLIPVIPEMLALGLALAVIGGAFALFGVGAITVAKAFQIMAESGKAGAAAIVDAIKILVTALPTIEKAVFDFAVGFAKDILKAAPLLVRLFQALLDQMLQTMAELAPKFVHTIGILIDNLVILVHEKSPVFIQAGFELLINFLKGIRDNIGEVATVVAEIIVNFLNALSDKVDDVADAVRHFIITVFVVAVERLTGLDLIFGDAGRKVMGGLLKGLGEKVKDVIRFFVELPGKIIKIFKNLLGIHSPSSVFQNIGVNIIGGLLLGLLNTVGRVTIFFATLPLKIIGWVGNTATTLIKKGSGLISGLLSGIVKKIGEVANWFRGLGGRILSWIGNTLTTLKDAGTNLVTGLWNGIKDKAEWLWNKLSDFAHTVVDKLTHPWKMLSPSKVMIQKGQFLIQGLAIGIANVIPSTLNLVSGFGKKVLESFSPDASVLSEKATSGIANAISLINSKVATIEDFTPVITPVLDLSKVQAESGNILKVIKTPTLSIDASIDTARLISHTHDVGQQAVTQTEPSVTNLSFEQNNYSPTALSTNDIYRNTKSQFALAKEKLSIS